ncbi:tigger transposable element-derived protein 6 [Trichonephila clavipes]|nr:tigger transposable element-derived protein 6 [Trichonephila clavipes]
MINELFECELNASCKLTPPHEIDLLFGTGYQSFKIVILYKDLTLNDYTYPKWAIGIGWILTASSLLCIPGYITYYLVTTPGTYLEFHGGDSVEDRIFRWVALLLKEKAKAFAKELGIEFSASEGWLTNFKKRNGIVFKKMCRENSSVDINVCSKWQNSLSDLIKEYEPRNIFNTDETGIFFKCLPEKTFTFKKEKCHGGKHSKERLTILLTVNMDGSEKITPLVIGKSAKPRCFKGINSFPTKYRSNKKAWMTTELFNEWLVSLNSDMKREKRYILLFLDYCTVQNNAPPLSNVKLQFFAPNSTSKLQPLDQGIVHNFKTFYQREVVKSVLDNLENQQHVTIISILTALIMIDKAWRAVTPLTIHSCFKKSCFPSPNLVDVDNTLPEFNAELSLWEALPEQDLTSDDYMLVDTDIAVWGALSDAEIVALDYNNTESDEDESEELTPVTLSEAKVSLNKLRNFFLQNHVDADILQVSFVLEKSIDKVKLNALKQNKITDFFDKKD